MIKIRQPLYGTGDGFGGGGFGTNDNNAEDTGENSGFGGNDDSGLTLDDYSSVTERNKAGADINGLDVSYNIDGTIDVRYGGFFDGKTMSVSPTGVRSESGFFSAVEYDLGIRSSFKETIDAQGNYTKSFDPLGLGNGTMEVSVSDDSGYGVKTYSGGFIASSLYSAGVSGKTSVTVEAVAEVGIALALGQPLAAIAPTAKALETQGIIDAKTSNTLQAVGLAVSFAQHTISSIQAFDAISTAKQYGAITDIQAAVLVGLNAYSLYNSFNSFRTDMSSLGFIGSLQSDMSDFGFVDGGNGELYYKGTLVTTSNASSIMQSFYNYIAMNKKTDYDTSFDKLAGSIFFNNYFAGGDFFTASLCAGFSLMASVGKQAQISTYDKMSVLGNDFIDVANNPYNIVKKYS